MILFSYIYIIRLRKFAGTALLLALSIAVFAQDKPVFQGQAPVVPVDTKTRPVEKQVRRTFSFEEDRVYFSNEFDGARLNKIERTGENQYTILITPENSPINMSPWYAFKVWGAKRKEINVKLTYPEFARHRYTPLHSRNGKKWKPLETGRITEEEKGTASFGENSRPKRIVMRIKIGKNPVWISAQELQTSRHVFKWINRISRKSFARYEDIGRSSEGRPLRMLQIGNRDSKKMMVVISRQHPPEVTGYFAMQSFVETIAGKSALSKRFRRDWTVYVLPLMNPDGVDEGHWRHNAGGIDLNRDWTIFNQPEGKAVSDFLTSRERETGGKFYFGIDFHSTWDDIYYPMDKEFKGNMPDLVYDWIESIKKAIPNYEPNIRPNERPKPAIVSRNYFYFSHGMEAIVFEIGDNTSRKFIKMKGRTGAIELMKLMLARRDSGARAATAGK